MLEKRKLGNSRLEVSPIGLGLLQFSGGIPLLYGRIAPETINATIEAALAGGINWFDTAEIYGNGRSERYLASALHTAGKKNGEVIIATKWLPVLRTAGNIRHSIKTRRRNLENFNIDLYQVHNPYSISSIESVMDAMADLV